MNDKTIDNPTDLRLATYKSMVGTTILDRYELKELIGLGGMGAVFRGVQRTINRDVALKLLPKLDPLTAARFHREAKTASRLSHPNTITVFDFGQTPEGYLFLVMEHLQGQTLRRVLKKTGPLHPRRALHVAIQVCRSLSEAHSMGIVHRDIKPDNIFLLHRDEDPDFVKVLDFGIAKILIGEDTEEDLTQQGRIVGTPRYMAPEQVMSLPVDHRADIYALCVILYQMLTGTPPFDDVSTPMLMMKHAHEMPQEFHKRLEGSQLERLPPGIEAVVMKGLSKRPDHRHQTIDALRAELELVKSTLTGRADPRMSGRFTAVPHSPSNQAEALAYSAAAAAVPRPPLPSDPSNPSYPPYPSNPSMGDPSHPSFPRHPSGASTSSPTTAPHTPWPSGQAPALSGPHPSLTGAPYPPSGAWPAQPAQPGADLRGEPQPPPRSGGRLVVGLVGVIVLLLLVVGVGVGLLLSERFTSTPAESPPARPATVATPTPQPSPTAEVSLTIESVPSGARIYSGALLIGETPRTLTLRGDSRATTYTLRLEGYQEQTQRFDPAALPREGGTWKVALKPADDDASDTEEAAGDAPADKKGDEATSPAVKRPGAGRPQWKEKNKAANAQKRDEAAPAAGSDGAKEAAQGEPAPKETPAKPRKPVVPLLDDAPPPKPKINTLD